MRRKSTRNSTKKTSPEKSKQEVPKKSRRTSRRRKRNSSESSEGSDESPVKSIDTSTISTADVNDTQGNTTNDDSDEDSIPLSELDTKTKRRRSKTNSGNEESLNIRPRRSGRSQASPVTLKETSDNQEPENEPEEIGEDEETEEKKGKGKSKSKNKSKIEKSSNNIESEAQMNHEISENVQVTPQSPSNDNPIDNENIDANNKHVQNVNESESKNIDDDEESAQKISDEPSEQGSSVQEPVEKDNDLQEPPQQVSDEQESFQQDSTIQELTQKDNNSEELPEKCVVQDTVETQVTNCETEQEQNVEAANVDQPSVEEEIQVQSDLNPENETTVHEIQKEGNNVQSEHITEENLESPKDYEKEESNIVEKPVDAIENNLELVSVVEKEKQEDEKIEEPVKVVEESTESTRPKLDRKRRISSISPEEEKVQPKPKSTKRIKLNRNISEENKNESTRTSPVRRQKWRNSTFTKNLVNSIKKVNVELLKNFCPNLEFLNENEIKLESVPKERKKSETEVRYSRKSSLEDSDRPEYEKQSSINSGSEQTESEDRSNIIAMNRKISIVDDTASKLKPPPSPAKNPTSEVLFITNLVRPFTIKQLKELLERTGKINEEGFWTDRIKSKCYVQYENVEEAEATRNALHGVNWPIGNGKKLIIDYATVEDLEKAKNPPPPPPVVQVEPEKIPEKENKEPERRVSESEVKGSRDRDEKQRKRSSDGHVREWDLGKEDVHRRKSRSRSRDRERVRKVSRRSATPVEDFISKKQRKLEEAAPQKLMDDLFLKTKATPSIYWQPLSPEEIATKQQQRLMRMEEHKRRMEESSRVRGRNDGRGASFRRR